MLGLLILCRSSSNWTRHMGRTIGLTQSTESSELALGRQAAGGHCPLLDFNPRSLPPRALPHSRPDSPWKNLTEGEHTQHGRALHPRVGGHSPPPSQPVLTSMARSGWKTGKGAHPRSPRGWGWSWDGGLPNTNPMLCTRPGAPLHTPACPAAARSSPAPSLSPGRPPLCEQLEELGGAWRRSEVCQSRLLGARTSVGQRGWANHGGSESQGQGSLICCESVIV